MAAKSRATQGWMMKGTVARLRKLGREKKMKTNEVDDKIVAIIVATVQFSYELHKNQSTIIE